MTHRTHQLSVTQQKISDFLFPAAGALQLPEGLIEFCRHSIEDVESGFFQPVFHPDPDCDYDDTDILDLNAHGRLVQLEPIEEPNLPIAAIDTSTMRLGELECSSLCALRGAVVLLQDDHYSYVRYGPLIFSLGKNSLSSFQNFTGLGLSPCPGEPDVDGLLKRMRNALERWLQFCALSTLSNGLILVDGSLTAGTPDNPSKEVERILATARHASNVVLAISKRTKLRIRNQSIAELVERRPQPCLLDVDQEVTDQFPPYPIRFLGRVFVAKLAKSGFPFRIDVDRGVPMADAAKAIRQLMGTDIVDQGYPETLRIAHILSTFTASDVLGMRVLAANRFRIRLMPKLTLRRALFGPFGSAWEAYH